MEVLFEREFMAHVLLLYGLWDG